jgi:hypothetical protein
MTRGVDGNTGGKIQKDVTINIMHPHPTGFFNY